MAAQLEDARTPGKSTLVEGIGKPWAGEPVEPGKRTLTDSMHVWGYEGVTQSAQTHEHAAAGVAGSTGQLPFLAEIQRAFGRHDVSDVRAAVGGKAREASQAIGARAYAVGTSVAFSESPDLHMAAHEAAHVVQQRRGMSVPGGVGVAGDPYEAHANQVADRVVAGKSAESLLDSGPSGGGAQAAVQKDSDKVTAPDYIKKHEVKLVVAAHNTALAQTFVATSPYATLSDAHAFAVKALERIDTAQRIRELIVPKKLEEIVDRIRLQDSGEWMESVGTTVGATLAESIQDSLARITPRYVDARFQATLAAEAKAGACPAVAPEPSPTDIVFSHPMDKAVALALCSGCVAFKVDEYKAAHPDAKETVKKPRTVQFTWESASKGTYWIRVTETEPATPEDVALTLFGASEQAYEITGTHPLFGFTHANKLAEPHKSYLVKQGEDLDAEGDPNAVLLDPSSNMGALSDELAKTQGKGAATGLSKDEIVQKMRTNLQVFDDIVALAAKFDLSDRLTAARTQLDKKSIELADPKTEYSEVAKWDGVVTQQNMALQRASVGLDGLVQRMTSMTQGLGALPPKFAELKLPDYVKAALLKPADAYVTGTSLCHIPATADAKLAEADRLAVMAPLEMLDGMLTDVVRVIRAEKQPGHTGDFGSHPAYTAQDTSAMAKQEVVLRAELARVRTLILTDPKAAATALRDLSTKIQDLGTEGDIVENIDELDRLWAQLDKASRQVAYAPSIGPASSQANGEAAVKRLKDVGGRCDGFTTRWKAAYALWKKGEKETAKQQIDGIRKDPALAKLLADCNQLFQDAADIAVVNRISALIGVTILTMGIGAWVEGVAVGLELGTGGTIAAVSGAEAITFVALSQAFLDSDHSVGHIATELAFNFVMFGALRRFSKLVEAAKLGAVGTVAVNVGGNTVITTALTLVKADIETYVKQGKHLTEAQIKQMCLESVVQAVAMTIATQGITPIMEELQGAGTELGSAIKIANEKGSALKAMTAAINKQSSVEEALAVIKAHREWGEAKLKALDELEKQIELEKAHPPKKGESVFDKLKLSPDQIANLKKSVADATATMHAAEAMLELDPQGPNTYTCPQEKVGKILEKLGGKPETSVKDPVSGLTTYTIKGPDGNVIKIIETKLGPNSNGTPDPQTSAPTLDTAHLPESSQSIARWQTDGISHDAPGTWEKKSADGHTFKDVYAEWMKQPERIRKTDSGWEPIYPKDCPPEFKPIFDKIVEKGNITLTSQGEANVAKLKAEGIDLSTMDPLSPEYLAQRDKIIKILGEDAVKRWEASQTQTAADKADVLKRINSVLAPDALASLRAAFSDCEIIVSGSMSQTGKPLVGPKGINDVDITIVVPKDTPMENRIAMERRAAGIKLQTTPEFQKAGGSAELPVDAKAMLPEEYMGIRTADPGKRTPLGDVRVDDHTPKADDIAKRYDVGTDPAQLKKFEALFTKSPVDAASWANGLKDAPGLAGRLLGIFGEAAPQHVKPAGEGLLDLHGHLQITPEKLSSINDADIARLVHLCEHKGPTSEYEYFEGSATKTKPGYRLRFPQRLQDRASGTVNKVLADLGISAGDPRATCFDSMDADSQSRLWDLANEGDFKNAALRKQASEWALSKSPKTARQFVAEWELYAAEVSRVKQEIVDKFNEAVDKKVDEVAKTGASVDRSAITKQVAAEKAWFGKPISAEDTINTAARAKALEAMSAKGTDGVTTIGAERADKVLQTNLDAQKPTEFQPGTQDTSGIPSIDVAFRIQSVADSLSFRDPLDAAYHAHKHAQEMATPPPPEQEMVAYLKAARATIKTGAPDAAKPAQQSKGQSVTFVSTAGDKCIVFVDAQGNASIATFLPTQ